MNSTQQPPELEDRLRHTLRTVAATVTDESLAVTAPTAASAARKRRRAWHIGIGVGAVAVPLAFAAAAVVNEGPEYVDAIPPEQIVASGEVDGSRYLLIESDRTGECGEPYEGVELVEEDENLFGSEWNTTGYQYGEQVTKRCDGRLESVNDTTRYLKNPTLFNHSGARVGDSLIWIYAVHPDVDTVRITSGDYTKDLDVYAVDGAGYASWEIPTDLERFTSELIIDGQVVPGSRLERSIPELP